MRYYRTTGLIFTQMQELVRRVNGALEKPWSKRVGRPKSRVSVLNRGAAGGGAVAPTGLSVTVSYGALAASRDRRRCCRGPGRRAARVVAMRTRRA